MTELNRNGNDVDEILAPSELDPNHSLPADRWEFIHVVHAVVATETASEALGAAIGAFTHLSVRVDRVDTHQLVNEFEGPPERYLTRRWGQLPGVTRIDSETGQRLLRIALERTREESENLSDNTGSDSEIEVPYLCTEAGGGITRRSDLLRYQRKRDRPLWVVPAVTFGYLWGGRISSSANRY